MRSTLVSAVLVTTISLLARPPQLAADWPMDRGDAARTARVAQPLSLPLELQWTVRWPHAPAPAWPTSTRIRFDQAFQPVVSASRVVLGSSVDGVVSALDLARGTRVWEFCTDGPIRLAPAVWRDRVFVASDDGYLYSLRLADGSLLWKRRGGESDRCVLGNEAMISKWPARGGPVVADGVVYFAAGIWPSEGIYVYALDAETGAVRWCNTDSGDIYMPQPHGGADARSGVSAQGPLVIAGDYLFVPTGRAVPACFDRRTGEFRYFHLQQYGQNGEALTMVIDNVFFNGGLGFDVHEGHQLAKLGTGQVAASAEGVIRAFGTTVAHYVWSEEEKPDRRGEPERVKTLVANWSVSDMPPAAAVVSAGEQVVLGSDGRVAVLQPAANGIVWEAPVEGVAHALAIADGRLVVSTGDGVIHCFGPAAASESSPAPAESVERPELPEDDWGSIAEDILGRTQITHGYCLDLGSGDARLAYELARRSQLRIIAVDSDPDQVARARRMLTAAGLYGTRVVVHCRPLAETGYPSYFADLIVSRRSFDTGLERSVEREAERLQRPYGGLLWLGPSEAMRVSRRGELPGAGSWTHQYADAANSVNSGDALVQGPLGMLWFRDLTFDIPNRHGRAPAPLWHDGRLFHQGLHGLVAVNAYNGRELWRYELPDVLKAYDGDELMGVAGTGSNFCVGADSVFWRHEHRCLRLDAATGTLLTEYQTPGATGPWGYIAWSDGLLLGSTANPEHVVTFRYLDRGGDMPRLLTESRDLFAIDTESGDTLWTYTAQDSIRHNAVAVAGGKVLLIDRPLALFDRVKKPESREHPPGRLVALDARTGRQLWRNDEHIYGTLLAASTAHNVLLMSYQPTRFQLDSELGGRMTAFELDTGRRLWESPAKYQSRPALVDRTIYAQGGAWDLLTGQSVSFPFERSYGCGILACSQHMMFFRSATLGYYDLQGDGETINYGGIRPGCWINTLPVGGLVLVPDATSGCVCSYLNKAWIALEPAGSSPARGSATER
jgi:outer membrane protein assembly factor BamB